MKLVINTVDGGNLTIEDFSVPSLMELLDDWEGIHLLTFALDDGTTYIPKRNITRIDTFD